MKTPTHFPSHSFLFAILLVGLLPASPVGAQAFSLGADIVSRYVWRGTDFGESVSIQPTLAFRSEGFEIGSWAANAVGPDAAGVNEHDLLMGYSVETAFGSFGLGVTDYYFPAPFDDDLRDPSTEFFNFDGDGEGAHWIEPYLSYTGPASFPITLFGGIFAHNDPDRSVYLEASYPFKVDGVDLDFTVGAVPMESAFYGTDTFAIVNLGLSASRAIQITDTFALPLSVAYILNPDAERSFLVFGISF